jgi:hypothetical protein
MMTHEFRIAAMIFGLSTSPASAQDIAVGETSYRKPQNINAYQSGNDSCVSLTDWIGLRRFVDVVSLEYLRHVR